MDIKIYWADVATKINEIRPLYPDGVVHLISRANREKNTTAGQLCTATVELAAECIVNNTHDLASPEQIKAYREHQGEYQKQILKQELAKKQQFVMVVDREEAASKGIPVPGGMEQEPPAVRGKNGGGR